MVNEDILSVEYLAGFIDGEGSIGLFFTSHSNLPQCVMSVCNTDRNIMIGIKYTLNLWEISSEFHCRVRGRSYKPVYELQVRSIDSVHELLKILYPSLKVKQRRAAIVLDYLDRRKEEAYHHVSNDFKAFAEKAADEMKELNKKGV